MGPKSALKIHKILLGGLFWILERQPLSQSHYHNRMVPLRYIVRPVPVFHRGRGSQNSRGRIFPIILARQEPQRYKNEILVL